MHELFHATIDTGHGTWSPRSAIRDDVLRRLVPHLLASLDSKSPIPTMHGLQLEAMAGPDGGLMAHVWAEDQIACSFAVTTTESQVSELWTLMAKGTPHPSPPDDVDRTKPWCIVRLFFPTFLSLHPSDVLALGDYERCVAWAWLEKTAG